MNNAELLKRGLSHRIQVLGAKTLMLEAQKDFPGALEAHQRKLELLIWLEQIIRGQVDEVLK